MDHTSGMPCSMTWDEVLDAAKRDITLFYHAPLDIYPMYVSVSLRKGGNVRVHSAISDFTADESHLNRFHPTEGMDMLPRYAPSYVNASGRGYFPVNEYVFHSAGHSIKTIRKDAACVELKTKAGSRFFGCESAYINSELRMVVIGCDRLDQVRMSWPVVPTEYHF